MSRKKGGPHAGHVLAFIVGVGMLAALVYAALIDPGKPKVDQRTLCAQGPRRALNAIVIDRSEPFNALQQRDILQTLKRFAAQSEAGEQFDVIEMGVLGNLSVEPVAVLCNPGGNKDDTLRDRLETTAISKRVFEERFVQGLKSAVQQELSVPPMANSPIMEMVQGVQVAVLKPADATHKRLIIVSDLMQHSSNYSQYGKATYDWPQFKQSDAFKRLAVDVSGVSVRILYVPRKTGPSVQKNGHMEFWSQYFTELGAKEVRFDVIEGGAWQAK